MAEIIRMPRLSDTMEEGNIVEWLKKEGDKISIGDVLAEVETDKATMDLESFQEGVLLYIGVAGGPVPVDGIIAIIGDAGEDYKALLAEAEKTTSTAKVDEAAVVETAVAAPAPVVAEKKAVSPSTPPTVSENNSVQSGSRIIASPLAKSMAKEAGIDLAMVSGSGENGRIVKSDIESYLKNPPAQSSSTTAPINVAAEVSYGDHPISQMRKAIARRLGESKFQAPHFYLTVEANMDETIKARKMANDNSESRISFNDIVIKACAAALRKHPAINSSWLGDKIRVNKEINIGVAVAVEEGLLVPVIRDADAKSLNYINQEVRALAKKAKSKKLSPQEMQGNTFTVSNLGMFGIEEFTAIINPPDACILAVGSIFKKPVVKNDEIVVGNVMKVTLSCDHRVVDGAKGAEFLKTLKTMLENPLAILA